MNKKIALIIFGFLIVFLVVAGYFLIFNKQPDKNKANILQDLSKTTDSDIIDLLKTNNDSLAYIEKYKDFKIEKKTVLTKESILTGQNGKNFKEVYQNLDLEDNRYLRTDLINTAGNWGLIAVLDFKNKSVVKAFGLMLVSAGMEIK
ncbi:hypothetical protein KKC00_00425 [Patescibacteria group bacterium]|nr:hypothetical protein [Patescibacteria group bacterium]